MPSPNQDGGGGGLLGRSGGLAASWRAGELGEPSTRAAPRLWPGRDAFFSLRELC